MDFSNTQWEARRASLWHILCAQKELQFLLEEGQAETSSKDVYVARHYLKFSLKFWGFMLQKCPPTNTYREIANSSTSQLVARLGK